MPKIVGRRYHEDNQGIRGDQSGFSSKRASNVWMAQATTRHKGVFLNYSVNLSRYEKRR